MTQQKPPPITPLGFLVLIFLWAILSGHAHAADYRYQESYQEPLQYRPVQSQPVPQNYMNSSPQQTVIVNVPQPEVVYVQQQPQPRRHSWNPIGAIMAVPRAALDVPGAILGGDDYYDQN